MSLILYICSAILYTHSIYLFHISVPYTICSIYLFHTSIPYIYSIHLFHIFVSYIHSNSVMFIHSVCSNSIVYLLHIPIPYDTHSTYPFQLCDAHPFCLSVYVFQVCNSHPIHSIEAPLFVLPPQRLQPSIEVSPDTYHSDDRSDIFKLECNDMSMVEGLAYLILISTSILNWG